MTILYPAFLAIHQTIEIVNHILKLNYLKTLRMNIDILWNSVNRFILKSTCITAVDEQFNTDPVYFDLTYPVNI